MSQDRARNSVMVAVVTAAALTGCTVAPNSASSRALTSDPNAGASSITQMLSPSQLDAYKKALPAVNAPKLRTILADPNTLWYDDQVMIPSYQDSVAPDASIGLRKNSEGADLIVPQGRGLFSVDGSTWTFPFSATAGTDDSKNVHVANFLSLPVVDGKRLPIAYWVVNTTRESIEVVQWRWMFPKGTVLGEVLYIKDASGNLITSEIRVRERYLSGWATNVYRPFPTASSLVDAVKRARPNWQADGNLTGLVTQLQNNGSLTPASLKPNTTDGALLPLLSQVFSQDGSLDILPAFGDDALVHELLTTTPFVTAYRQPWKENGGQSTYAASTAESFSIVPQNYKGGLIEVSDDSCHRCHRDAQRAISDFADDAVLYGDIWGADQIFSFHIFDQSRYNGAGDENRAVNPAFAASGIVEQFDQARHPANLYQELKN